MNLQRVCILAVISVGLAGCATSVPLEPEPTSVEEVQIDSKNLTFIHPKTGHIFTLHLGDELYHDTGGITEVPRNIRSGFRDATSSYYEPRVKDGGTLAPAESLYRRELAEIIVRNTKIQYQPDSGRLLIMENKSDGSPGRRYILYTMRPAGGYFVTYLSPQSSDIVLLPGDKAWIGGRIIQNDKIEQSSHPFSVGI